MIVVPGPDYLMNESEQRCAAIVNLLIRRTRQALGDEAAFSVVLSRLSRELRRAAGPDTAAQIFYQLAGASATPALEVTTESEAALPEVVVPDSDYRMDGKARYSWDLFGIMIQEFQKIAGDVAFTVVLSCVSQTAHQALGASEATRVLHGFASTQQQAVQYDQ